MEWLLVVLQYLAYLFVFAVGVGCLYVTALFIIDITQTSDAIRRNYPVVGRFRGIFTKLGEFFRQYFFAMDREEMPFNRAVRQWVYEASAQANHSAAFGSTKCLTTPGTAIFVNCPFPTLDEDGAPSRSLPIGPNCRHPYQAPSFFNISGMSFGALSKPAVRALSHGAKLAGCWLNTGEGGLSPYHLESGCDIVFQIGTAKYGVRGGAGALDDAKLKAVAAHPEVKMFEVKLSQGAKPGKGGILPGAKVTPEIAQIRGIEAGVDSISPNRHPEIDNVGELLDFIGHVRAITGKPTGFKTVLSGIGWIEDLAQEIHARGLDSAPDFITLDGGDGGTGAAPMALMDNVGLPVGETLPMLADCLHKHGLAIRIPIIAAGKLITPSEVAWALCAGASFVNAARGFMFAMGCIQALRCNKNNCPTGITTHNPRLQRGLDPSRKSVRIANYCVNLKHEVEVIAHSCGVREPRLLRRKHVRILQDNGLSVPMDRLFPYPPAPPSSAPPTVSPHETHGRKWYRHGQNDDRG